MTVQMKELIKEDKFVEETKSDPDDNKEVEPPKKDFGVDSSVIKMYQGFINP